MDDSRPRDSQSFAGTGEVSGNGGFESAADHDLLAAAHRGQHEAFRCLVERHQHVVYGYLRARLLGSADVDDLCQEVFLRCYANRRQFEQPEMVRRWLLGIARNVLREHIRRTNRRREIAWTTICLELEDVAEETVVPQSETYVEVAAHLPNCIESLGESARDALEMHYRARLRLSQIGEKLRRSEGAIKQLMYRARQVLRRCLSEKTGCELEE